MQRSKHANRQYTEEMLQMAVRIKLIVAQPNLI